MESKCKKCGSRLLGRHCLEQGCGWSLRATGEAKPHKKPEPPSSNELITLLAEHKILLPSNAIEWRGQDYIKGEIPSLNLVTYLIATDGVVAWFLLGDRTTTFFGHLNNFVEDEKEPKPHSKAERKSKKQQELERMAQAD